jgi:hypothetical protein
MAMIWTKPIEGPKGWRGEALKDDPSWVLRLDAGDLGEIDAALTVAKQAGKPLHQLGRDHFPLDRLAAKLDYVLDEVFGGRGFVVVRGIPVGDYTDDEVGTIFWGLGRYLGRPVYQNPNGDLLGHVYDHGRAYGQIDVRGYETKARLPFHTDGCDIVGLLCLRKGLAGGLSSIVSSTAVHNEILANHPEYLGLLYNGFYYIRREEALSEKGVSDRPIPVFGCRDGVVSCRYLRNQINAGAVKRGVPLTRIETAALDYFDALTQRPDIHLDMDLQLGDIQFCNNYTILHSRTEFLDGPDPHQKRHMLRLWLKFPDPMRWPIDEDFPGHNGYVPSGGSSLSMIEA